MEVLDYIIKRMKYDVNINDKINFNRIDQEMSITGTLLEDKKYIDIYFKILAKDEKKIEIFSLFVVSQFTKKIKTASPILNLVNHVFAQTLL